MEKRNRKAGHSYSLRDRILAQIMVIIVTLTMIPFDSLVAHAATTTNVKSIGSIQTEYEVDNGTSKDDIGLPSELSVILETVTSAEEATNGVTNEYSEDTVEKSVSWEGDYDGDTAGTYALTAEFDDSSLYYDDMPTVYVTVREPETTEEEPAEVEPVAEEPAADEEIIEEVVTEEPVTQEAAPNEAQKDGESDEEDVPIYHPTGREESNLNKYGPDDGHNNMRVTYTKLDGSAFPEGYELQKDDDLIVKLEFWEDDDDGIQFDMNQLVYTFPNGFSAKVTSGTATVTLNTWDGQFISLTSPFVIDNETHTLTYTWKKDDDENHTYVRLANAEDAAVTFTCYMYVNGDGDEFEFEDGTEVPVDLSVGFTVIKQNQFSGKSHTLTADEKAAMEFAIFEGDGSSNVRAKDGDGNEIPTFTYADMEETASNQAEIVFSGLIRGEYTVKEISQATIPEYTLSSQSSVFEQTHNIPASSTTTFDLKNVYVQDHGSLVLKKDFAPDSALKENDDMNDTLRSGIKFHITGPDGFSKDITYKEIHDAGGEYTLNELAVGKYYVVETSEVPGYECTSTSYVVKVPGEADASGGNNASADVKKGEQSEATFTNSYRKQLGSLKLTKTFEGLGEDEVSEALKNNVKFTIKGPEGFPETVVTYAELVNGVKTFDNIPIGKYTIQESGATSGDGWLIETEINGTADADQKIEVTVSDNQTTETTYKNKYTKVGSLKIIKKVTGDKTYKNFREKSSKASVEITYPDGTKKTVEINAKNFGTGTDGEYILKNIPIGSYTVTETGNPDFTNFTRVTTYDGDSETATSATSTVRQDETATVMVKNDYSEDRSTLKIKKNVTGDITSLQQLLSKLSDDDKTKPWFVIKKGTTDYKQYTLSDLVDAGGELTVELPVGSTYSIQEINADIDDYIRTTTVTLNDDSSDNPTNITVTSKTQSDTVTFTNNYSNSGKLRISKSYIGLSADEQAEVNSQLVFQILDADNNDAVVSIGEQTEFSLAELMAGVDLPVGHYKVKELRGDEYKPEVYTHNENTDIWSMLVSEDNEVQRKYGRTSNAQAVTHGDESYIYFWNRYSKVGVGVGIIKYVIINGQAIDTDNPDADPSQFTVEQRRVEKLVKDSIRFYVYEGSDTSGTLVGVYAYRPETITDEEREAGVKPASQMTLEPGTYTIEEKHYEVPNYNASVLFYVSGSIKNSPVESRDHKVTFTVVAGGHIGIDITNGYMGYGNLVVKKTFGSNSQLNNANLTPEQKQAIKFTVTGYKNNKINDDGTPQTGNEIVYGPKNFTYADMTEVDGVFQKEFLEIPIGVYVVKEDNTGVVKDLYNCTKVVTPDANYYTIELGDTENITFTNTYTRKLGNLEVKKTFAGAPLSNDCDLSKMTFTVTGPDGYSATKTYDQFTNGVWTINNLPTGTYTVKETGADYEDNYYERTTTVSVDSGAATPYSDAAGVSGAVPEDDTLHVELINSYKEVGALIFNKTFVDDKAINKLTEAQKDAVAFTVKDNAGKTIATITYADIKAAVAAGELGYKILVDAPADYTITESADISGYARTTTVKVDGENADYDEENGVSAHVEKFSAATVDFTNEYAESGKLTVTKNIQYTGDLTEAQQKAFKFTVTDPEGNVLKDADGNEIGIFTYFDMVKDNTGKVGTKTFENLPAGTYHIKEEVLDENTLFYGLVRTTTITVGTNKTNGVEADFDVTKNNPNVIVTNKYDNVPRLEVIKNVGGEPKATVEVDDSGFGYPVWKFTLDIKNLSVATTENGMTEIKDTYDVLYGDSDLGIRPEYFRTLTAEEAAELMDDPDANKLIPEDGTTVTITENGTDGSTIRIEGVDENTTPNHSLTFYLIPKDLNALGLLNLSDDQDEAGEDSPDVIKSFNNSIQYKDLPQNPWITQERPVEYRYSYTLLHKEAVNYDALGKRFYDPANPEHTVNYAVYEIIMNEKGDWLGPLTADYVDVEDEFSNNQYVLEKSMEFFRWEDPDYEPADEAALQELKVNVDYTLSGTEEGTSKIKFRIENGKKYMLRYRSELLYTAADLNKVVDVWNTVRMLNKGVTPHPEFVPTGFGDASEYFIEVRKADRYKNNIGLAGAKFELYRSVSDARNGVNCMGTYTTGADGSVIIRDYSYTDASGAAHVGSIHSGEWALKEVEAPPGYELIDYIVEVILANRKAGETADFEQHIYLPSTPVGVKDKPYEGKVELGALKDLIGSNVPVAAGDYEFTLTGVNGAPTGKPATDDGTAPTGPVTKTNDATGKARFGEILFRTSDLTPIRDDNGVITGYEPTTFNYTITETDGGKDGITYDTTSHTVEVKVSLNDDDDDDEASGTLDVEVEIDGETVTAGENDVYFANISNEYNAEGPLVLGAKKTIKGRKLRVEEFTFEAELNDADNTVVSAKNAEENVYNCDIVFPKINYVLDEGEEEGYKDTTKVVKENDGTYTVYIDPDVLNKTDGDGHRYADYQYTIKEAKNDQLKGITFDETRYPVTVRVTDLDNGELKITVLKNNVIITEFFSNFKFVNVYKADGQATLTGKKIVENDEQELAAGTYEFNVYDITNGEELLGKVTHGAATAGNLGAAINFPTIKAVVLPDAPDDALGMKVTTGNDGYVKDITITYHNIEDFKNEDGSDKEFKFKFNELHGGEVRDGIQYSNASYEATVTVAANSTDESKLDVNLVKTANEFNFINTPMEAEGKKKPSGTKSLKGKELKEGDFTFDIYYDSRVIGHVTNDAEGNIKYPWIKFVLDAGGTEGVTVDRENDTTEVTITVRNPGKLAGPYKFTVVENTENPKPGIVYPSDPLDRKTFTATARMKQGSNTEIEVTLTDADALNFINTFGAEGQDKPVGKKVLEGRDLRDSEFWFGIKDANDVEIGRVTNDLDGNILYPTFKYVVDPNVTAGRKLEVVNGQLTAVIITVNKAESVSGTSYTAYEIKQSEAGITYDTDTKQTITVTASVADDGSEVSVTAEAEEGKEFTNTYYAEGQATPEGLKELTNRLPELGEFKFAIKEGDTVITDKIKSTDDLNDEENKKKIDYPTFKYTVDASKDAGTTYDEDSNTIIVNVQNVKDLKSQYNYTISEVIPEGAVELEDGRYYYKGVTYDVSVIKLTVNVGVNLNDQSRLNVTINKSTGNDFKNEYETKGELKLKAKKTLLGRILNSGEFTFQLKDEKGKVLQEKQNVKDTITFDAITYTQENMDRDEHGFIKDTVYKYTVSEVTGNAGGVTYDKKEYKITVTLHDNKDGTMNVKVEDDFSNIIDAIIAEYTFHNAFVNYYNAVGEGTFSGTKTLKGRQIKDGDDETVFTFKIAIGGKEFTLTNTGNEIKYPKLKFVVDSSLPENTVPTPIWEDDSHETIVVKAGVLEKIIDVKDATADPVEYVPKAYEYTVTEEAGNAAGISYATTTYTVTATVSLNKDDHGKLDVNVQPNVDVSFTNYYRAKGEGTGKGMKYLYGRVIKDKEFTFTITDDKSGKVLGTVVNDATGEIKYPVFKYVVEPDSDGLGLWTEEDAAGHLITVTKVYDSKEALEADLKATYTVKELKGDTEGNTEAGITYDTTTVDKINVSVEVTKE